MGYSYGTHTVKQSNSDSMDLSEKQFVYLHIISEKFLREYDTKY